MDLNSWAGSADLCYLFRYLASKVYRDIGRGRAVGLVPWETTFTDNLLLELATARPHEIFIRRFGADEESVLGADWLWWFHDQDGYVGLRVQAKRAHPETGHINLKQPAPRQPDVLQAEVLARRAQQDGVVGLYCLYTDHRPGPHGYAPCGPCPHGPLDHTQWGCALLLAETAARHGRAKRTFANAVLRDSWPWYHLVCRNYGDYNASVSVTQNLRILIGNLIVGEPTAVEQLNQDRLPWMSGRAPDDIVAAFAERSPALVARRPGVAGAVLLEVSDERRR
ncbi:DUF6615 family protein [Micromonospora sicca]|uniref:DUF6615 family protein n=1 Tax=Micromonospora sicca TaxID=2202420 RepID=UPI0011B75BAE|nr:DUF6615 family protein [Micromonospora sp. 4G51]